MRKLFITVSVITILMLLCMSPISLRVVKGDNSEKFGVVTSSGVEMFKSKDGETYPIVTIDGKRYVEWNDYEVIALDDAINCESGKSDIMLKKFVGQYYKNYRKSNPPKFYAEYYNAGCIQKLLAQ